MPFPLAALAIPSLISAGTSLASGILGSKAAKGAADAQIKAILEAAGIVDKSAENANAALMDNAEGTGRWVTDASEFAAQDVTGAADRAAQGVTGAAGDANALLRDLYGQYGEQLAPYLEAGGGAVRSLAELAGPGGDLARGFTAQDLEMDPGYQFRLNEGLKALERSRAARGVLQSGGTAKAITDYAQGAASQEYGNAFDRAMRQRGLRTEVLSRLTGVGQDALGRSLQANQGYGNQAAGNLTRAAEYAGEAGMRGRERAGGLRVAGTQFAAGAVQDASNRQAANTMDAARMRADLLTGAGAARAAGQMGSANAWSGTLQGLGNTAQNIGQYLLLRDLLKP